jgi:hypothetical protein
MHLLLILLLTLNISSTHASDEKTIKELFDKYERVMTEHKTELIDDVFTKKFIRESGGKEEFIEKIKELPKAKKKTKLKRILERWKKSKIGNMFIAKIKKESQKNEKNEPTSSNFVLIEEDGKLKIDGTVSDDE